MRSRNAWVSASDGNPARESGGGPLERHLDDVNRCCCGHFFAPRAAANLDRSRFRVNRSEPDEMIATPAVRARLPFASRLCAMLIAIQLWMPSHERHETRPVHHRTARSAHALERRTALGVERRGSRRIMRRWTKSPSYGARIDARRVTPSSRLLVGPDRGGIDLHPPRTGLRSSRGARARRGARESGRLRHGVAATTRHSLHATSGPAGRNGAATLPA